MNPSKIALLLRLLVHDPRELGDRLLTFAEFHADRLRRPATIVPSRSVDFRQGVSQALGGDLEFFLGEARLAEIERDVSQKQTELCTNAKFSMSHDADFSLARMAYAICRQLKPVAVVETGVAHGVTSAFLLQALEATEQESSGALIFRRLLMADDKDGLAATKTGLRR